MVEYIEREAAKNILKRHEHRFTCADEANGFGSVKWSEYVIYSETAQNCMDAITAVDVRPVVHGEWEHKVTSSYAGGGATFCSVCGYGYSDGAFFEVEDFDYCPHCGATMKVDRRDIELL